MRSTVLNLLGWSALVAATLASLLVLFMAGLGRVGTRFQVAFQEPSAPIACGIFFAGIFLWLLFLAFAARSEKGLPFLMGLSVKSLVLPLLITLSFVAIFTWNLNDAFDNSVATWSFVIPIGVTAMVALMLVVSKRLE